MIISIDTETTGLEETDRPFCATVSGKDFDVYTESPEEVKHLVSGASKIIMQNSKFDARMLSYWGVDVFTKPTYDCTFMGRIIRNDHIMYNLESQAKRIGLEKSKEVDQAIKKNKLYEVRRNFFGEDYKVPQFNRVDRETLKKYALLDSRLTYILGMHYFEKADARDLKLMQMESQLTPVCYQMERRGLFLNQEYTLAGYFHEKRLLDRVESRWKALTGDTFVNTAKSIQKHIAYVFPTTDKGNASLTDDVIDDILCHCSEEDQIKLKLVREIRSYAKRINTYYESYLNSKDKDNVIHPAMWQAGTRTGRFSYSNPNLQNIPKEEGSTEPYVIRGCFSPRPGYNYYSFDFSQMEYILMSDYANEKEIIRAVNAGADFHQATADLFNVSRKFAKTINFAILYGAGDSKLAGMLGVKVEEARRLRNKYFSALPNVEKLVDDVIATGRGRGYVTNWCGRKLYAHKEFCYALPNHLIQSGGADVVKLAMIQIAQEFKGQEVHMILQVHDQLVFEIPPALAATAVPKIKDIMETIYRPMSGAHLRVDIAVSRISLAERDMQKYVTI